MYQLTFLPIAKIDIQEIVEYYDDINSILANAFLSELEQTKSFIQMMPEACQKRLGDVRVLFLKRFRYGVYFKIYDKRIVIMAILHTSRNPKIWKKR